MGTHFGLILIVILISGFTMTSIEFVTHMTHACGEGRLFDVEFDAPFVFHNMD